MAKKHNHPFPHFDSVDTLVEYVETHDIGDDLESMPEVRFDVDIQARKHLVTLEEDIAEQVEKIALRQRIPSEVLINTWLREKIAHVGAA